jgi:16S rRNA (cytosine967-C5)-methyltransferase
MKIYKNLVNAVAETLQDIFTKNRYADKALEKKFKSHPQWGSRDRRFVAEAVYDIVRYKRFYEELIQSKNNFWFMTAAWMLMKNIEFPDWLEFQDLNRAVILQRANELKHNLPVYESYPDWLWELGLKELGKDNWEKEARALNTPAKVVLRVNTLKNSLEDLEKKFELQAIPVEKIPGLDGALVLMKKENIFRNPLFREGCFEIQDAGSQQISTFLAPRPGDTVIDACAGAGGKSLHIAALMKNKGRVISMDIEQWKLDELKKRAKRAGAFNTELRLIENKQSISSLREKADRLLLDVPCSGSGVIKRNPDTKWKLSAESFDRTKVLQQQLLSEYSEMLKTNGEMVYSTCSLFPSENQEQIKYFLHTHPQFQLIEEKTLLPSEGFDGFYMARLIKKA